VNVVSVVITAADGTTRTQNINVTVTALSSNTDLSSLKVDGVSVIDGQSVSVANGRTLVVVAAVAVDADALVAVSGASGLRTGSNAVSVKVIAADATVKTYSLTLNVLRSSSTQVASVSVNGVDAASGAVTLPARTTSASVKVVLADANASAVVSGASSLQTGVNVVSVVITAADGTTRTQNINVTVTALSSDSTLKSLKVSGVDYVSGQIDLPVGAKSIAVVAVANGASATVDVSGNTSLVPGLNNVRVRVTAENGSFSDTTVKVFVASRSTNSGISSAAGTWTINGVDVSATGFVLDLPVGTVAVSAKARPEDAKATVVVTGTTGLLAGLNSVKFTVTAEDGTSTDYTRNVRVAALSSNANLVSLTVADTLVVDAGTVTVPFGTSRVSVVPVLASAEAKVSITGNSGLLTGANSLVVTVTAPSGASVTTTINVQVTAPAANTALSSFTVNDVVATNASTINVAAGTSRLKVSAIAQDGNSSVTVTGKTVTTGSNTLTVTVTALSGASTTYTVTVIVGN
jgi:hypothetical protein